MNISTEHYDPSTNNDHKTKTENNYSNSTTTTTRSTDAHRGITIRGSGPASGRPLTCPGAVDLRIRALKIVSGWSQC